MNGSLTAIFGKNTRKRSFVHHNACTLIFRTNSKTAIAWVALSDWYHNLTSHSPFMWDNGYSEVVQVQHKQRLERGAVRSVSGIIPPWVGKTRPWHGNDCSMSQMNDITSCVRCQWLFFLKPRQTCEAIFRQSRKVSRRVLEARKRNLDEERRKYRPQMNGRNYVKQALTEKARKDGKIAITLHTPDV